MRFLEDVAQYFAVQMRPVILPAMAAHVKHARLHVPGRAGIHATILRAEAPVHLNNVTQLVFSQFVRAIHVKTRATPIALSVNHSNNPFFFFLYSCIQAFKVTFG
ncbi:MAG: hypothetical protein AYK19_14155 [Theionarchaea archaeon DG-70-1]|nr:MAG: hypothetical protein AYK19_14155 [Theionarchaea archaeon DG-70-1]